MPTTVCRKIKTNNDGRFWWGSQISLTDKNTTDAVVIGNPNDIISGYLSSRSNNQEDIPEIEVSWNAAKSKFFHQLWWHGFHPHP